MIANMLVGLVALIHLCIVVLEMLLWNKPAGRLQTVPAALAVAAILAKP